MQDNRVVGEPDPWMADVIAAIESLDLPDDLRDAFINSVVVWSRAESGVNPDANAKAEVVVRSRLADQIAARYRTERDRGQPWPRVSPCRWCGRAVLHDNEGAWIHADLAYACRDRWGTLIGSTAEPASRTGTD